MIRPLTVADIPELQRVQTSTLPGSLPLAFGPRFFRVYMEALLADPRFFADGFHWQDRLVGFLTYASDSSNLLRAALRRRFFAFGAAAALGCLTNPARIATALRICNAVLRVGDEPGREVAAELLSYGVLPEFRRTSAFHQQHHIHIAHALLRGAYVNLHRAGAQRVQIFIGPHPFIKEFYAREGFHYVGQVRRFGLPCLLGVRELSSADQMATSA